MLSQSQQSRLRNQFETVSELIRKVPEEVMFQNIVPDKWSIFENIAHLTSYQFTFFDRLQKILNSDNPSFERYVAENDARFFDCLQQTPQHLLASLREERMKIVLLVESLTDQQFDRTASHPRFGILSVIGWVEFFLLHEAHHLYTIFSLVAVSKAAGKG